jgi:hypothetical protein
MYAAVKGASAMLPPKKVNNAFEEWMDSISFPAQCLLESQLTKAFPILNKNAQEEVASLKTNLAKKESLKSGR